MTGRLWGVGLGPGDPELVTVKAARLIGAADVIAFHSARHGRSIARSVAAPYLRDGQIEEHLVYPLTTETTDHPGGYQGAMDDFYADCAARLAAHLDAGRDVVVLAEGDPLFYGSYMHMHKRLADRYPCRGRARRHVGQRGGRRPRAAAGASATRSSPCCPAPCRPTYWPSGSRDTDAAAVMKLGRTFGNGPRGASSSPAALDEAWYVERATTDAQRTAPLADVDPDEVPYFSLALLPSPINNTFAAPADQRPAPKARSPSSGSARPDRSG